MNTMNSDYLQEMRGLHELEEMVREGSLSTKNLVFEISKFFDKASREVLLEVLGNLIDDRLVELGTVLQAVEDKEDARHTYPEQAGTWKKSHLRAVPQG